jgi:hypothetical protein
LTCGDRDAFLKALAAELDKQPMLGPGVVHRIAREIQARLFSPPLATD